MQWQSMDNPNLFASGLQVAGEVGRVGDFGALPAGPNLWVKE
jgi:hypothetical protein